MLQGVRGYWQPCSSRYRVSEDIGSLVAVVTGCQRILAALYQPLQGVRGYWQPCSRCYRVSVDMGSFVAHMYTVLRENQIQITLVPGWKRAWTKTLFVITKIAFEFHNSPTFTKRSDIMSCIWSSLLCM